MVFWSVGLVVALGLVCLAVQTAFTVIQTRAVVHGQWPRGEAVGRLGGPRRAAERLALYARLPGVKSAHRQIAVGLLSECGTSGVPALIGFLVDGDPIVQLSAVDALARIGPEAAEAGPALARLLAGPDPWIGALAATALGRTGPAEVAIPELTRALASTDARLRSAASEALKKIKGQEPKQ
jgi:hypothetical protein